MRGWFFIFNETFVLLLAAESCFVPRTLPVQAKLIGNKFAGKSGWHGVAAAPDLVRCIANNILGVIERTMYRDPLHNHHSWLLLRLCLYNMCAHTHAHPLRIGRYTDVLYTSVRIRQNEFVQIKFHSMLAHWGRRTVFIVLVSGWGEQNAHVSGGKGWWFYH